MASAETGSTDAAGALRARAIEDCRSVIVLLEERSNPAEADGYKRFLMDIARATATAYRHGGWFRPAAAIDEQESSLLCELSAVLGVDISDVPETVTCEGPAPDIPAGSIQPE